MPDQDPDLEPHLDHPEQRSERLLFFWIGIIVLVAAVAFMSRQIFSHDINSNEVVIESP